MLGYWLDILVNALASVTMLFQILIKFECIHHAKVIKINEYSRLYLLLLLLIPCTIVILLPISLTACPVFSPICLVLCLLIKLRLLTLISCISLLISLIRNLVLLLWGIS